jgi:ACR3 family arsenite efflux pump ArsB
VAAGARPLVRALPGPRAAAWALSRLFDSPTREGVLSLGLAPTETAAAGLVALAAGDAALALALVTGSLIVSALLGPLAAGLLAAPDLRRPLPWERETLLPGGQSDWSSSIPGV